jgi:hypothetical protein
VLIEFRTVSLERASIMTRKWISIILILFSLNAFSLNLGYNSPIFLRFCGFFSVICILALYGNSYFKIYNKIFSSTSRFAFSDASNSAQNNKSGRGYNKTVIPVAGLALILVSLVILMHTVEPEFWIASLIVIICGLDLLLRSAGEKDDQLPPLALGTLIYVIFYIFYINDLFLWLSVTSISRATSGILGRLVGTSLAFGPTISGTLIFLTFFFFAISFYILSEKKSSNSWKSLIAIIIGLLLVYAIYFLISIKIWTTADEAMDLVYMVFLALLIPFIIFVSRIKVRSIDLGSLVPSSGHGLVLAALFLSILLISIFSYFYDGGTGKAVIYEKDSEMGFNVPEFPGKNQSFGPDDGFSVGAMKLYLENIGFGVEGLNSTNSQNLKDALKDANILVLLNLRKPFPSSELESIKNFVKEGGGLLIFGEHTSMFVPEQDFALGRDYLNDVLNQTGIQINPDTADYIPDHWQYASSSLPHYVTKDLGFEITTSSVGASLSLREKARPLIIGRFAFSDKSNMTTPGHLGDRLYERDEMLGDLVIAASDTYGRGKVLVFGDTSYVFNNELPFRYNLLYNSVTWLVSQESNYAAALRWASFLLLSVLAAFILVASLIIRQLPPKITLIFLIYIALTIAVSLAVSANINDSMIKSPQESKKDLTWIDHTHLNQFNLENYRDDSIAGLTTNLFRNGYLPQVLEKKNGFSDISKGNTLIIIAPNEHYTQEEANQLRDFVDRGGMLIISAGYESAGPLDSVLRSFGLQIGDLPLGSPPWIEETHGTMGQATVSPENLKRYWHEPKFMEAYPVSAHGEFRPITWMRYGNDTYNLILQKKVGLGDVVLIGDSRFLLNENLEYLSLGTGRETREQYQLQWLGNIELLREILAGHKVGRA